MSLLSKIKTAGWYFRNPKLLPDMFAKINGMLQNRPEEKSEDKATRWCRDRAITPEKAFKTFFKDREFINVKVAFQSDFAYALQQQTECPVQMGGPGCIDFLYNATAALGSRAVLETGVAYGWSTFAILLALSRFEDGSLVSTDMPYAKAGNENVVGCVVPDRYRKHWLLLRESDITGLPKAIARLGMIDLCHYDSDKSFAGRMRSLPLLWNALRPGGMMICDDISDNIGFQAFCESIGREAVVFEWDQKYVGVLQK